MLSLTFVIVAEVGKFVLHLHLAAVILTVVFALGDTGCLRCYLLGRLGVPQGEGTSRSPGGSVGVDPVVGSGAVAA